MFKTLITTLFLFILFSCGNNLDSEEIKSFIEQDIPLKSKIKKALEDDFLDAIGFDNETKNFLKDYYQNRNYTTRWINDSSLNEEGLKLKLALDHSLSIGIPEKRSHLKKTENFIQDEFNLTAALAKTVYDLQCGLIDYETKKMKPTGFIPVEEFDKLVRFNDSIDLNEQFSEFGPKDTSYQVICKGLVHFYNSFPVEHELLTIDPVNTDSIYRANTAKDILFARGYLKNRDADSITFISALKFFQEDNALKSDAKIGKYTIRALNESNKHKIYRIILALDKIRSHEPYPAKSIRINIPEYKLRLYINDSLKSENRIIVGTEENQTPELQAELRQIVANPTWSVPYSIASKEILPILKRSPGYLSRNNMKLFRKDVEINPYNVSWRRIGKNSFPYKIIQQPGPGNSLGILKFNFTNKYDVYFHDTPAKGLFGTDVRSYSHGCMRTQNPVDLAKIILQKDTLFRKSNVPLADSLDSIIQAGNNRIINLVERIPIYVEYRTVVREKEKMVVHLDIYGRDEEYVKIMTEE